MSVEANTRLIGRLFADAQRLGFDAIAEPFDAALPLLPSSVARLETFNRLLREHGLGAAAHASVASIELLDLKSISSNCNNAVARIEPGSTDSVLPETLFVKLPSTNLWTRLFCNLLGIWRNECHFYRDAASRVPFCVPKPFIAADRGSRFVLVLEDLHARGDLSSSPTPT